MPSKVSARIASARVKLQEVAPDHAHVNGSAYQVTAALAKCGYAWDASAQAWLPAQPKPQRALAHPKVIPVPPIRLGETIKGTNLRQRWEGKARVSPVYEGGGDTHVERVRRAMRQAAKHGFASVNVDGQLYFERKRGWHFWNEDRKEEDRNGVS